MKKTSFLILVVVSGIAVVLVNFLVLLLFLSSLGPEQLLYRVGLPGIVFIAVYFFFLGRGAPCFGKGFFEGASGDIYNSRLKKIGALPIKNIALVVLLELVFLGVLFFRNEYLGAPPELKAPLFIAALALGMLVGTFVYVLTDYLVSSTLITHSLTGYPRDLREGRQAVKTLIIPLAVAILSICFTFSVAVLSISESGVDLSGMGGGFWLRMILVLAAFFVIVFVLAFSLKKTIVNVFHSVIRQLENLSSERKDLSKRISICSVDELGTIAGMVNSFCENMGGGMKELKTGQKELADSGMELENHASAMAALIVEISNVIEQVNAKTESQRQSVTESSAAVEEIARNIESLDNSISKQAGSISRASVAVEEMVGNIGSIGNVVERMSRQFETVNSAAKEGTKIQQESRTMVQEIVEESKALQDANKIIATIAAQTNLLAMNAAIEAAHAGEAGRGFAVVADEIRKLAENSSRESQNIHSELKQIVESINSIVTSAQASEASFTQVSERLDETQHLVTEVDNAVREQKEGTNQVLEALKDMNNISADVKTGSAEMNEGNASMLKEMNRLQTNSREISASMNEMIKSVGRINSGAQDVSSLAQGTQLAIEKISRVVDSFEV
ncbi:MAG: methyl-accepting chemotaxis protein [Treponema sp.]|jgi:methyl-accepting chemotaxis protein|nr:methyl-accepting chemotaxis protein [Treponema sp.]